MKDVQSFLHLLLVFKLHEQTMKGKFDEIAELEKKIDETLESSIRKILRDGTDLYNGTPSRVSYEDRNRLQKIIREKYYNIRQLDPA
jgi:hypothetical protein